jgi:hypothetical protein
MSVARDILIDRCACLQGSDAVVVLVALVKQASAHSR